MANYDIESNENISLEIIKSPFSPSVQQEEEEHGSEVFIPMPESALVLVALRLAILEKAASGLGVLAFVWATVVLLGGFVSSLESDDFWVISVLLLTEGTRIFSRSHELEWQQAAPRLSIKDRAKSILDRTKSIIFANQNEYQGRSNQDKDTEVNQHKVFVVPYATFLTADRISSLLYYMQLGSALVCIGLSVARFIKPKPTHHVNKNQEDAIKIFYSLVLAETVIFIIQRGYWEYQMSYKKIIANVSLECQHKCDRLKCDQIGNIKRFFYEVYSICLKGSVFDGLNMDLLTYAIDDIQENDAKEQLGGASLLLGFLSRKDADKTTRRIGTTPGVVKLLIEMLNWKEDREREIRLVSACIISHVARQRSLSFRIVAVAGALENIVSLLTPYSSADEDLQLLGLCILKRIAVEHRNCVKIANTEGLLPILVGLIELKSGKELEQPNRCKVVKKSLQLLRLFAMTTGYPGRVLREDVASVVFTIRNLRNILEYCQLFPVLRETTIDILTNLALENSLRENIGSTGGIIRNILELFLFSGTTHQELRLCVKAGEALSILALRSPHNCFRMCGGDEKTLKEIITKLNSPSKLAMRAAKILRHLCMYLDESEARQIATSTPKVLRFIMGAEGKELEAALGLAAATVPYFESNELEVEVRALAERITGIVSRPPPLNKLLRVRRYAVELATVLMSKDGSWITEFKDTKLQVNLREMRDTISDVENFYTFSGEFGLTRHTNTMEELIDGAMKRLK